MKLLSLFAAALAVGGIHALPPAHKQSREVSTTDQGLRAYDVRDVGLQVRTNVKNPGKITKPPAIPKQKTPSSKDKLLSPDEVKTKQIIEDLEKNHVPNTKGWHKIGSDEVVAQGRTGFQVKEKDGQVYVLIMYGDSMPYHASHQKYHLEVNDWVRGFGYKRRKADNPQTRDETLSGIVSYRPSVRDENPPLSLNYLRGSHTVMRVPNYESVMQGTLLKAAKAAAGPGGIIQHYDNRTPKFASVKGLVLRGPEGDVNGYNTPAVRIPEPDEDEARVFLFPVPRALLPAHLHNQKRQAAADPSSANFVALAPMWNYQMTGDDLYVVNASTNASTVSARSATVDTALSVRDIISSIEDQQSNADDTSVTDEKDDVELWLYARSLLQTNATILLQPYIDALMNGSNSMQAEAMAWNLYSMINPSISAFSPFLDSTDQWDDMAAAYAGNFTSPDADAAGHTQYATALGDFNSFVYSRAVAAVNATGLLADLAVLEDALAAANSTSFPDEDLTVGEHDTDPLMDYLAQMAAYNGFAWDGANATDAEINAPLADYVLSTYNMTIISAALAEASNTTTANNVTQAANTTTLAKPRAVAWVS